MKTWDLDLVAFFENYRLETGKLTQVQAMGLTTIMDFVENDIELRADLRHVAYVMATIKHETSDSWVPIREHGGSRYWRKYSPGTFLGNAVGNTEPGDGERYSARGYCPIRGRRAHRELGEAIGVGDKFERHPELVNEPKYAWDIISVGMRYGLFTGKKLSDYIALEKCNYKKCRKIINGRDNWKLVAAHAEKLELILRSSFRLELA